MVVVSFEVNGKIFNLGGDCVISLKDLVEVLIEVNGGGEFNICFFFEECKCIDIGDYYFDYSLIELVLGWKF